MQEYKRIFIKSGKRAKEMRILNLIAYIILISIFNFEIVLLHDEHQLRTKRSYFLAPMGGLFKLVIGVVVPVQLGLKQNMVYALNFQYQYMMAQNRSQLETYPPIISKSRERRQVSVNDRALVYLGLESLMDRYDVNGKQCLLQSICENAMNPISHKANGLYGEIINIILTPYYNAGEDDLNVLSPEYADAQKAGKFGVDCISLYPKCSFESGMLDFISIFNDISKI